MNISVEGCIDKIKNLYKIHKCVCDSEEKKIVISESYTHESIDVLTTYLLCK